MSSGYYVLNTPTLALVNATHEIFCMATYRKHVGVTRANKTVWCIPSSNSMLTERRQLCLSLYGIRKSAPPYFA